MTVPRALSNNSLIKVVNRPKKYEHLIAFSAPLGVAYNKVKSMMDSMSPRAVSAKRVALLPIVNVEKNRSNSHTGKWQILNPE